MSAEATPKPYGTLVDLTIKEVYNPDFDLHVLVMGTNVAYSPKHDKVWIFLDEGKAVELPRADLHMLGAFVPHVENQWAKHGTRVTDEGA